MAVARRQQIQAQGFRLLKSRFMQELQDDPEVVRAAIKPLAQAVFWCSQKQRVFRMPDKLGLWFWCDRGDVKANLSSIPMEEKNPRATDYI